MERLLEKMEYIEDAVEYVVKHFEPYVKDIDFTLADEGWYSVLIATKNTNFTAWLDIEVKDKEVINIEWNDYIFNLRVPERVLKNELQNNDTIFELSSNTALDELYRRGIIE